jgi:hypothetical protein
MGAVRKRAVFWVAVLKRDPVPPLKDAIHPHPKDGAFWHMVVKEIPQDSEASLPCFKVAQWLNFT